MKAPSPSVQMLRRGTIINYDYEPAASPNIWPSPSSSRKPPRKAFGIPRYGQDTDAILGELGKSELEIEALKDEGAR